LPDLKPGLHGAGDSVDAVTREIIRGKLLATADEMGIVIARTSMSPVIYEVLDFACGVCDPDGELIVQTNGITLFTGTFAPQVQSIKGKYLGKISPGDIYMTNDPFEGGTHSADIALIKPVFVVTSCSALRYRSRTGARSAVRSPAASRPTPPKFTRRASASLGSGSTTGANCRRISSS
jgi:Hydantoinase B/oxoprolinase